MSTVPQSQPLVAPNTNSIGYRFQHFLLWVLCTTLLPFFLVLMLIHILVGSAERAHNMAVAFDEAGNSGFGGPPQQTMSAHIGDALVQGKKWATYIAPVVDFMFGKGHCLSNVDLPQADLTADQQAEVNQADAEQGDTSTYPAA